MTDLATWLLAQIADDELFARQANMDEVVTTRVDRWSADKGKVSDGMHFVAEARNYCLADHVARWDPKRAIDECAAKRRVVLAYQQREAEAAHSHGEVFGYHATGLLTAIRLLALPYASRDGYQEEWKP